MKTGSVGIVTWATTAPACPFVLPIDFTVPGGAVPGASVTLTVLPMGNGPSPLTLKVKLAGPVTR